MALKMQKPNMTRLDQLSPRGPMGHGVSGVRIHGARLPAIGWSGAEIICVKPILERLIVVLTFPLWGAPLAMIWLIIKLSDLRSPALLSQERTGLHGIRFKVFKLRTMVPNAEQLKQSLAKHNLSTGPDFKMRSDPRITSIGRILRKSHLDELPQLINILKGEMSLVGPRPCTVPLENHEKWWLPRLLSKPGLTGLFQIYRSNTHDFDERVRLEIRQMKSRSFPNDLKIILRTFAVAFVERKGF